MSSRRPTGSASPRRSTPDASIALGTNEVNLLELVSAYAPFANGGNGVLAVRHQPRSATAHGKVVYRRSGGGPGRVVDAATWSAMMNEMLAGVVDRGTGKAARLPRPAAGKTGTTQEYRDAWFIGYTADLVAGVWLGNDDNTPMNKVTGGSLPAPAWRDFMLAATRACRCGRCRAPPAPGRSQRRHPVSTICLGLRAHRRRRRSLTARARASRYAGCRRTPGLSAAAARYADFNAAGENAAGTTSMFSWLTNWPRVAGGQAPVARASSRIRKRSAASL